MSSIESLGDGSSEVGRSSPPVEPAELSTADISGQQESEVGDLTADRPAIADSIRLLTPLGGRIELVPITALGPRQEPDWLWPGLIARGAITLLTGLWKAGKTTLLMHLISDLQRGAGLVDRALEAPIVVVSEESDGLWIERRDELGLDENLLLLKREKFARPGSAEWRELLAAVTAEVERRGIGLVIFDTLPSAWPVLNENDAGETLDALTPLRALAAAGAGVLLVAHPRKGDGDQATATRGSGAITGFVDVIIELRRANPQDPTDPQRTLRCYGRFESTPPELVIELGDDGFRVIGTIAQARDADVMATIASLLPTNDPGVTREHLLTRWPNEPKPGKTRIGELLSGGVRDGRWSQSGTGRRNDPFRYRSIAGAGRRPERVADESERGHAPESQIDLSGLLET